LAVRGWRRPSVQGTIFFKNPVETFHFPILLRCAYLGGNGGNRCFTRFNNDFLLKVGFVDLGHRFLALFAHGPQQAPRERFVRFLANKPELNRPSQTIKKSNQQRITRLSVLGFEPREGRNQSDLLPAEGRLNRSENTIKLRRYFFVACAGPLCTHAPYVAFGD
jgi:hypothetical protein